MKQIMGNRELRECVGGQGISGGGGTTIPSSGGPGSGGPGSGGSGVNSGSLLGAILTLDPALSKFFSAFPQLSNFLNSIILPTHL
jgi:hypothetical protein